MTDKLRVSEMFYSIQGEGITTGIPAFFIRLSACNLMCGGYGTEKDKQLHDGATWRCDTIEVWQKGYTISFDAIIYDLNNKYDFINRLRAGAHIIFTGGEPLMQQDRIVDFIAYLALKFSVSPVIEIETNGTIMPSRELLLIIDCWNCSPKLSNSGMPFDKRVKPEVLKYISSLPYHSTQNDVSAMFKFVVSSESDWKEIESDYLPYIKKNQIVIMPAASTIEELHSRLPELVELCKRETIRFCDRLHVEIWNQLTGV